MFETALSLDIIIVNFHSREEIVLDYNCLLILFPLFYKSLPAADVLFIYLFICFSISLFVVYLMLLCVEGAVMALFDELFWYFPEVTE